MLIPPSIEIEVFPNGHLSSPFSTNFVRISYIECARRTPSQFTLFGLIILEAFIAYYKP
jgi:hypothetical protein